MNDLNAILRKIKENNCIMIFRHIRADGDCVGASKGLKALITATWPDKNVYLIDEAPPKYLEFLGFDDPEVADEVYQRALGIVVDTASSDRISNRKFALCKELIKIDHHIPVDHYGDIAWVEQHRSSCSEMIAAFYETFRDELVLTAEAAKYLYTGIVTDSGRFRYEAVNGDTLRLAAMLLDMGIDTQTLYAQLYLEDLENLKFKSYIYQNMQQTPNGVAYIFIDRATQERFDLTHEQAGACVSALESIRGCLSWMVFIETGDENGTIRVRLRSRFVHINTIAEKYRGGGHACACGATLYSRAEMDELLQDTDALVKDYKETHEDWL